MRNRRLIRRCVSACACALIVLPACGSDPGLTGAPATTIDGDVAPAERDPDGSWQLTSGRVGGEEIVLIDGWDVTLTIEGDQIGGVAACNGYGGSVDLDGGAFSIGELSWTEMGCEPAVMDVEQTYLSALQLVDAVIRVDDGLTLTGPDVELVYESLPAVPDEAIVGTTWVLDTMIEGEAATNSPLMSDATLLLSEDGMLTGSTSCRQLEGEWVIAGNEVVFTTFAAIDDSTGGLCSEESLALDGFIVTVLGDGFSVVVDGDRMTVTSQGNEGLSYVAR